jgi:hypothetical protein
MSRWWWWIRIWIGIGHGRRRRRISIIVSSSSSSSRIRRILPWRWWCRSNCPCRQRSKTTTPESLGWNGSTGWGGAGSCRHRRRQRTTMGWWLIVMQRRTIPWFLFRLVLLLAIIRIVLVRVLVTVLVRLDHQTTGRTWSNFYFFFFFGCIILLLTCSLAVVRSCSCSSSITGMIMGMMRRLNRDGTVTTIREVRKSKYGKCDTFVEKWIREVRKSSLPRDSTTVANRYDFVYKSTWAVE